MSDSALALSLALFHCWTIGTTLVAVEDLHSPRQRVAWKRWTLAFDACSIRRVRARQVVTALDRICDILLSDSSSPIAAEHNRHSFSYRMVHMIHRHLAVERTTMEVDMP